MRTGGAPIYGTPHVKTPFMKDTIRIAEDFPFPSHGENWKADAPLPQKNPGCQDLNKVPGGICVFRQE